MSSAACLVSNYDGATYDENAQLYCECDLQMRCWSVNKEGENKGKKCTVSCSCFLNEKLTCVVWRCKKTNEPETRCEIFIWEDERAEVIARIPRKESIRPSPRQMLSTKPNKNSAPRGVPDCSDEETVHE